ncbi:hypothetical protein D0859_01050 [Hortaea werneckii]|uniref:Uncharacterized protein n=1 Tax=Hortaea werneckii TaxID=91943 RepID=A0A3M7JAG4_HORWE|nr:hypothetical protein D0859_01050 [Hortaea werneckii]
MRLLHRDAQGTYYLKEIADALEERYAILSHRWYPDGDILYADLANQQQPEIRNKQGWRKLRYAVDQAERDRYRYVWIDTCCIDKTSSTELSEAINSMFFWYQQAQVCYAYLWDISSECPPLSDARTPNAEGDVSETPGEGQYSQAVDAHPESAVVRQWRVKFTECSWFTRGWTLQELIAPREVRFFGVDWNRLGSSHHLVETIAARTLIDADLLRGRKELKRYSIAQRMSWAADRVTSRIEDRAYSLLGLFDVNVPLLYGEREKAFMRLQEEIIRRSNDQSILAWGYDMAVDENPGALLARSPADFRGSSGIRFRHSNYGGKALQLDSQALRGTFFARWVGDGLWTADLNCEDSKGGTIKLSVVPLQSHDDWEKHFEPRSSAKWWNKGFSAHWLDQLGSPGIVAVARAGHGFCSRISSSRAFPGPLAPNTWPGVKHDYIVAEGLEKLRIVLSRGHENFYCGPLKLSVYPSKIRDRGLLKDLIVHPEYLTPATTDLAQAQSLRPVVTRFTHNDAAALVIQLENQEREMVKVTCTAKFASQRERNGGYDCMGSLVVKRFRGQWKDSSLPRTAWHDFASHPKHRFLGHAAFCTLDLKDGWRFSTRMTVMGSTVPEVHLELGILPPTTSRTGNMGGPEQLAGREDGKVQFEAA